MTEKQRYKLNGILVTIAFHLLLVLLFLAIKLKGYEVPENDTIVIDFQEAENQIEALKAEREEWIKNSEAPDLSEQTKSNIAVNVTKEVEKDISTEKYVDEVLKELNIESLNPQQPDDWQEELPASNEQKNPPDDSADEQAEYAGETKIKYALDNRQKVYIPVPSFKCINSGIVVIDITVNQDGEVVQTSVSKQSSTTDECLVQEALNAARSSYFNRSKEAPARQKGYISFEFRAQDRY